MKIITRKGKAAEAVADQYAQYSKPELNKALAALGPNPDPDDVDAIVGDSSWTRCECNECGKDVEAVVELGEEPDYDNSTAWVCFSCLEKAFTLVKTSG